MITLIMTYISSPCTYKLNDLKQRKDVDRVQSNVLWDCLDAYSTTNAHALLVTVNVPPFHLSIKRLAVQHIMEGSMKEQRLVVHFLLAEGESTRDVGMGTFFISLNAVIGMETVSSRKNIMQDDPRPGPSVIVVTDDLIHCFHSTANISCIRTFHHH